MSETETIRYTVELSERAYLDFRQEYLDVIAVYRTGDWLEGFWEALGTLKTMPYRSIAPESNHFPFEVFQIAYRRTFSQHRILFSIEEHSPIGRRVRILHIHRRHHKLRSVGGKRRLLSSMEITTPIAGDSSE